AVGGVVAAGEYPDRVLLHPSALLRAPREPGAPPAGSDGALSQRAPLTLARHAACKLLSWRRMKPPMPRVRLSHVMVALFAVSAAASCAPPAPANTGSDFVP